MNKFVFGEHSDGVGNIVQMLRAFDQMTPQTQINRWSFMLREGRVFIPARRPSGVRKRANKMCFRNAFELRTRDDSLIYCEGYAEHRGLIPCAHAWCVTNQGVVIDPTWSKPEHSAYFGLPIAFKYACSVVMRNEVYGVMEDWEGGFELLSGKAEGWRAAEDVGTPLDAAMLQSIDAALLKSKEDAQ